MSLVEPVIMQLLMNAFNRPQKTSLLPSKTGIALTVLAAFLGGTGIVYLLIAFHAVLIDTYSPAISALATGAAALLLAAFAAGVACHLDDIRKAKAEMEVRHDKDSLMAALEAATAGLEEPIAAHPRTSVVLASLAGFMAANKMHTH